MSSEEIGQAALALVESGFDAADETTLETLGKGLGRYLCASYPQLGREQRVTVIVATIRQFPAFVRTAAGTRSPSPSLFEEQLAELRRAEVDVDRRELCKALLTLAGVIADATVLL